MPITIVTIFCTAYVDIGIAFTCSLKQSSLHFATFFEICCFGLLIFMNTLFSDKRLAAKVVCAFISLRKVFLIS